MRRYGVLVLSAVEEGLPFGLSQSIISQIWPFLARRFSVERNSYGNVVGWVAGWLSHSGIVSKRLNLSENFFDHLKAPSL